VTEFVLKLHPQRATVYAGDLIFSPSALEKIVDVTNNWLHGADDKAGMIQVVISSGGKVSWLLILIHHSSLY
jgi:hypothetical protein